MLTFVTVRRGMFLARLFYASSPASHGGNSHPLPPLVTPLLLSDGLLTTGLQTTRATTTDEQSPDTTDHSVFFYSP